MFSIRGSFKARSNFVLIHIGYDRFFHHVFSVVFMGFKLELMIESKKQKEAFVKLMQCIEEMPDDF